MNDYRVPAQDNSGDWPWGIAGQLTVNAGPE